MRKYEVGNWTYGRPLIREWGEGSQLKIGKFCSIAGEVLIFLGGNHRTEYFSQYPFHILFGELDAKESIATKGDVAIGHDVWLGHGATILSGVNIGNGAVIGARSLVVHDVPPYAIAVGNPAKVIKYRFADELIVLLQQLKWWDWQLSEIKEHLATLMSGNIEALRRLTK